MDIRLRLKNSFWCTFVLVLLTSFALIEPCPDGYSQCYHCADRMVKPRHREKKDSPNKPRFQVSVRCTFPCSCDEETPTCHEGVNTIVDGCQCCRRCARQQGDVCDTINKCDEDKDLVCNYSEHGPNIDYVTADNKKLQGTCRAKEEKPCHEGGQEYQPGEKFNPSCNKLCTCQNGIVSCSSLCRQELDEPNCKNAKLVSVKGRCCKEWVCVDSPDMQADAPAPVPVTESPRQRLPLNCKLRTSDWSACSVTCGVGESYRVTNDNAQCEPNKEIRLCQLRTCEHLDISIDGICRPTTKPTDKETITWKDCTSVSKWKLKYCSTCKKNRCCTPNLDKTITMDFYCKDSNATVTKNFMWIKNCKCHRTCPEYGQFLTHSRH